MSVVNALVGQVYRPSNLRHFRGLSHREKYRRRYIEGTVAQKAHRQGKTFTKKDVQSCTETSLVFPHHVMSGAAGRFTEVYGQSWKRPRSSSS